VPNTNQDEIKFTTNFQKGLHDRNEAAYKDFVDTAANKKFNFGIELFNKALLNDDLQSACPALLMDAAKYCFAYEPKIAPITIINKLEAAHEKGNLGATAALGYLYEEGCEGVIELDKNTTISYYDKAKYITPEAAYRLMQLYIYSGRDDDAEAVEDLANAYYQAQYEVGRALTGKAARNLPATNADTQERTVQSYNEGFACLMKAADGGSSQAASLLSKIYTDIEDEDLALYYKKKMEINAQAELWPLMKTKPETPEVVFQWPFNERFGRAGFFSSRSSGERSNHSDNEEQTDTVREPLWPSVAAVISRSSGGSGNNP